MPLPAGVETVAVTDGGVALTLPDGTLMQGLLTFTGPDLATVAEDDFLFGWTAKRQVVDGRFDVIDLVATDATGIDPTGFTYKVTATVRNGGTWTRYISLPKATPTVVLADILEPDPASPAYTPISPASTVVTETSYGQASAVGTSTQYARGDHTHGTPTSLTPASTVVTETGYGQASAVGIATSYARSDHTHGTPALVTPVTPWLFDVTAAAYGAVGDAQTVVDGTMSSGSAVLTSATGLFTSGDVGKAVQVKGAGPTGVTTLVTTIASRQSATQVTLSATNASGGSITGAQVIWGTDDTTAIQAAIDAAETYLASHTYAQVFFPPRPYVIAGPLRTTKSGNGQLVFGVYPMTAVGKVLELAGVGNGANVRTWLQTVPQFGGSCLISFGVYASTSAQISDINAHGNPAVICGPNEGSGYGVAANYSNVMPIVRNLAILTTHSTFGLTYGALNFWGCAKAHLENVGYGTAGTVASPSTDYTSPGVFGTGLSVGLLLPAPGNNDYVVADNVSCGGGYTYAAFVTEHLVMSRYMALYCWAGLVAVGTYAGSVGSVHAMKVLSASIEACTHELYIMGAGSSGVGPIIDIDQLSTESSTPNIAGNSTGAMNAALGKVRLTGLFTETGVSVQAPTGIELIDGQVPRAIKRKTGGFTCSPIDRTLICDTTSAGFTGTLPLADFNPVEYCFRNAGPNTLTVATTGGQTINGSSTATLSAGQTLRIQALFNGSVWGWFSI